jgi:hypothetical protein
MLTATHAVPNRTDQTANTSTDCSYVFFFSAAQTRMQYDAPIASLHLNSVAACT